MTAPALRNNAARYHGNTRFSRASIAKATALALALVWVLPAAPAIAAASAPSAVVSFGRNIEIQLPVNAYSPPSATLYTVSCASPGSCIAGGLYFDRHAHSQALVVAQSQGRWRRASELQLPASATGTYGEVRGIACPAAGYCAAVGDYIRTGGHDEAFFANEVRGRWLRAVGLALPLNGAAPASSELLGVSCTSSETCTAAGIYTDHNGNSQAMVVSETNGHLVRALEISAPVDAVKPISVFVSGISCFHPGDCVAVGEYSDTSGASAPMSFTESRGHWGGATTISLPKNALTASAQSAPLNSVSCTTTGFCTAVGEYYTSSAIAGMSISGTQGLSGRASEITVAPPGTHPDETDLNSLSCPSAQHCVAVGVVFVPTATNYYSVSISLILTNGHWANAHIIQAPVDALSGANTHAVSYGTSCTRSGYCAAVGAYTPLTVDPRGMAAVMP